MINKTNEKSPFFVDYTGKKTRNKGFTFHARSDADVDLKKFFNERFGDISNGEILEQIVYDYYFRFAHERTYYEKTIIAFIHKKHLASDDPDLIPLFVLDRFAKDNENDVLIDEDMIANYDLIQYIAWSDKFEDVSADLQKEIYDAFYNDSYKYKGLDVFQDLRVFDKNTLKDFFVLEIPLNNYLDAKINGVYCYEDNDADGGAIESMHVGLAIVKDNDADINATPIPILYAWKLQEDFSIQIELIEKADLNLLQDLCQRYNPMMFAILKFFEIANYGYEDKLKNNRQQQKELQEQLDELKQREQELIDLCNDESSN